MKDKMLKTGRYVMMFTDGDIVHYDWIKIMSVGDGKIRCNYDNCKYVNELTYRESEFMEFKYGVYCFSVENEQRDHYGVMEFILFFSLSDMYKFLIGVKQNNIIMEQSRKKEYEELYKSAKQSERNS